MAYIESIQCKASTYGMVKIIPPKGHEVPYRLRSDLIFNTKKQYPSRMYQRWGTSSRQMAIIQACACVSDGLSGNDIESNETPMVI